MKLQKSTKRISLVRCAAVVVAVCAAALAATAFDRRPTSPDKRLDRSKLLIGAYYLQPNARSEAHVKAVRDCGVDFICGLAASQRETLDLFEKYGLGAIVLGVVPGWGGGDGSKAGKMRQINPPEKYIAGAKAFKDHPAIWGIDIGDEPSALDFPYFAEVVRIMENNLPVRMPLYMNLYPNYARVAENSAGQTKSQLGTRTYAEHIEAYCRKVPLDYISYDFYPYFGDKKRTDAFLSKMYDNFMIVSEACRREKKSFWYVPQVNSRQGLPPTNLNRLRFQANAALSFGAEAITWGCWSKGWWVNNVLDENGNQTVQYGRLKRVNRELKRVGPRYMRFRNVATRFVGFPAQSAQNPSRKFERRESLDYGPFSGFKASNGARLVVGEMVPRKESGGERALFATAADDPCGEHPANFELVFKSKTRNVRAFGGNGEIPVVRKPDGSFAVPVTSCQGVLVVAKDR